MPIQNPGSGQTVSGSVSVAENSHYISQQIIDSEVVDSPIILIPATEDKVARAYWIFNNSESPAMIQLGLNPGLVLPLKPGIIYEDKDNGGLVNQVTLISGKVVGILKLADALPEEPEEPEEPELIFAPLTHPEISGCLAGNTVFAVPDTVLTFPIYMAYDPENTPSEVIQVVGYSSDDFTSETTPIYLSEYFSPEEPGISSWQISPSTNGTFIRFYAWNILGGNHEHICVSWQPSTNSFHFNGYGENAFGWNSTI